MGRKIWSIIGLLISWAMLSPVKNAITNLHGHTTRAAIYLTIFILGMAISWTSVTAHPVIAQPVQQKHTEVKSDKTPSNSRKNSGYAIASLVLGLVFFFPLASILAIVFGLIALDKIKKENLGGKEMAIAGIILGILGLIVSLMVVFSYVSAGGTA